MSLFSVTHAKYTLFIELHKGFYVKLEDYIENAWFESDHEFIFKILDVAWSIPGFNLNIKYGDKEFEQEIQYYKIHGRKMPFFEKMRKQINDMPFFIKILFIWILAPFLYAIYLFIKMSIISK